MKSKVQSCSTRIEPSITAKSSGIHRAVCSYGGKGLFRWGEKRRKGDLVDQEGNNELAAMTEALESAFANVSRTSVTDLGLRQLSELANQAGVSSFIGRIALAGQNSDGTFRVQFNVDGDGVLSHSGRNGPLNSPKQLC